MKKLILSICGLFSIMFAYSSGALASDSFNYASFSECENAMNQYESVTEKYVENTEPFTVDWRGWMSMDLFFTRFATSGERKDECVDGNCVYTADAGCGFVGMPVWNNLLVKILDKEVNNNLLNGKYDPTFTPNTSFKIVCHYKQGQDINWNQCSLEQK